MHSQLHFELYRTEAADRARRAPGVVVPIRRQHPPPIRGRAAYATRGWPAGSTSESARKSEWRDRAISRPAPPPGAGRCTTAR